MKNKIIDLAYGALSFAGKALGTVAFFISTILLLPHSFVHWLGKKIYGDKVNTKEYVSSNNDENSDNKVDSQTKDPNLYDYKKDGELVEIDLNENPSNSLEPKGDKIDTTNKPPQWFGILRSQNHGAKQDNSKDLPSQKG